MKKKGVTQEDVAEWLDRTQSSVSRILNNPHQMTYAYMATLAAGLGVDIGQLTRHPDEPQYASIFDGLDDEQVDKVIQIAELFRQDGPPEAEAVRKKYP